MGEMWSTGGGRGPGGRVVEGGIEFNFQEQGL